MLRIALVALALGCFVHGSAAAACIETTTTTVACVETRTWVPGHWDRSSCRESYVPGHWDVARTPTRVVDHHGGVRRDQARGASSDRDRCECDQRIVVIDARPPVCIR
jgi:hypothetical protein